MIRDIDCAYHHNGCKEQNCNGRGEFSSDSGPILYACYVEDEASLWRTYQMPIENHPIKPKTLASHLV